MNAIAQIRPKSEESADAILLTAVMESLSEGIAIVEDGRILQANGAFARTFGYGEAQAITGCVFAGLIPESPFIISALRSSAKSDGETVGQPMLRDCGGLHCDGTRLQIPIALVALQIPQRDLLLVNIPSGKSEIADDHWLDSQKMEAMGRLVGGVAHDFNNLLTGILLYCDLLLARMEETSPLRAYVDEIRKAGGQSAGLIRQLLTLSRPQAEEIQVVGWEEILLGLWSFFQNMLGENIALNAQIDGNAGAVRMDPSRMRQIALNLLLNARDAMPEGGSILLGVRNAPAQTSQSVEFSVTDRGCGMDATTRSHMFEPFFSTKVPGRGNGLGLATVQRIVSDAHGNVAVASAPGEGTTITVRLPREPRMPLSSSPEISPVQPTEPKAR